MNPITLVEHAPRGHHLLVNGWDADRALLDDAPALLALLQRAVRACGATVLHAHAEQFVPQGVSVVIVLAESHATLHTYPEHGVWYADVFTCGAVRPDAAVPILHAAFGGYSAHRTAVRAPVEVS